MKTILLSVLSAGALALSAHAAEVNTKLSDVHICCQGCEKAIQTAIGKVEGATVTADQDAGTVVLLGPDLKTVQKAADALVEAGYFGKSSNADVKVANNTGAKGEKVKSLKIEGLHLCCGQCVRAVDTAVKKVPGVENHNATRNAKVFEVTGDFNDKEVFEALQKAGLTGKVAKPGA